MSLSFTNFNKELPQPVLKQAQKLKVRDLDELNAKHFVAYVDDKSQSFDVSIRIDTKKNIVESSCDCEQGNSFCVHKTALLIFLAEQKKAKTPVKVRAKKLDPLEVMLNQIEADDLKKWLFPILKKNAELSFLFEKEFAVAQKVFTTNDIESMVQEAIKSVVGRRKSIQTNEVAKLVNMLEVALQPVLDFIENDLKNVQHVLLITKINDILTDFHYDKHISSVKLIRLVEKINNQFFGHINNIQDLDLWKKHLDFFFLNVFKVKGNNLNNVAEFLKSNYELAKLSPFKLEYFVFKMRDWFDTTDKSTMRVSDVLSMFVLDFYIENKLLSQYAADFSVRRYADNYNLKLINALVELEEFKIATLRCKQVIQSNQSEVYNSAYYKILKTIYLKTNDEDALADLIKSTIKYDFTFEELSFLSKKLDAYDYKVLVTGLKKYYRSIFYSNQETAPRIYFGILFLEKNYKQIFSEFQSNPLELIFEHRKALMYFNKNTFWDKLTEYGNYYEYNKTKNQTVKTQLIEWAWEVYGNEMIAHTEKRMYNPKSSPFFRDFMVLYNERLNK